jgi:hypothetical protein
VRSSWSALPRRRSAAITACICSALPALAAPKSYIGPNNGNWSTGTNWNPVNQPATGDDATILASGTGKTVIYDVAANGQTLNSLSLDGGVSGPASLDIATGTLSASNIYVGKTGVGRINQSNGATITLSFVLSQLILGNDPGSHGDYYLTGGTLNSSYFEIIGSRGSGYFQQTGGTNNANNLTLAAQSGSTGLYRVDGGTLNVQNLTVSGAPSSMSSAEFIHTAGAVSVTGPAGLVINGGGDYVMTDSGSKTILDVSQNEYIGASTGVANLTQHNGAHRVLASGTNGLFLGKVAGASGTMTLLNGTLQVSANTYVGYGGAGKFEQSGGVHTIGDTLFIAKNFLSTGNYNFTGGTLQANTIQLNAGGTFSASNQSSDSLKFDQFNQTGGVFIAPSVYFSSSGTYGATYNLSGGNFIVTEGCNIGINSHATFNQTGGNSSSGVLRVGQFSAFPSAYNLSGPSTLSTGFTIIDLGRFTQSGGTHTAGSLTLALGDIAPNTYELNGGTLNVTEDENIGPRLGGSFGTAGFTDRGGTHTVGGTLYVGQYSDFNSFLLDQAAILQAKDEIVGLGGNNSFNHFSGTNTAMHALYVGPDNGQGSYSLFGGSLFAANEYLALPDPSFPSAAGRATFSHTGGVNTVNGTGNAALFMGGTSTYTMNGTGAVLITPTLYVGYSGAATFELKSGTANVTSPTGAFWLGYNSGDSGTLNLSGGNLNLTNILSVGGSGSGTVNQTGGVVSASGFVIVGAVLGSNSAGLYNLSGGTLSTPNLTISAAGTFNAAGGTVTGGTIDEFGVLNITATGSNAATFASNLPLGGPRGVNFHLNGNLIEQGTITLTNYNLTGSGQLQVDAGGSVAGSGSLAPTILSTTGGAIIAQSGNLTIPAGVLLRMFSGSLQNAVGANLFVQTSVQGSTMDDLVANAQGSIVFSNPWVNFTGHSITLNGGAVAAPTLTNNSGGTITGFGQLNGNVTNVGNVTLNGATQFIGPVLNQSTGSIIVSNNQLLVTGALTNHGTVRAQTGGTLIFDAGLSGSGAARVDAFSGLRAPFIRQNSLSLFGNAGNPASFAQVLIKPKAQGGATSLLKSLTLQTDGSGNPLAMFDLADNALAVDYTGTSPLPGIRSAIIKAWANGTWSGPGITSSVAAGDPSKALGFAESTDILGATGGNFAGQPVDGTATLVRYTLLGDANLDGIVSFPDLVILAQNYNATVSAFTDAWWSRGDFNYDGVVNFADLVKLAQNYNSALATDSIPGPAPDFRSDLATALTPVPEPAALATMVLACALRRGRHRRRVA